MSDNPNMEKYELLRRPPKTALKTIKGGRLSGMTDINPQWRYEAMTAVYGPCGQGWDYVIDKLWLETSPTGEVAAFAQITLRIYAKEPPPGLPQMQKVPGIGGSVFVASERSGLRTNDEAYKMAVTDALSVAMKMLGVGADIYMGRYDGSKYADEKPLASPINATDGAWDSMPEDVQEFLRDLQSRVLRLIGRKDVNGAMDEIDAGNLDNEVKIAFWTLLDAPTRKLLKEAHAKRLEQQT